LQLEKEINDDALAAEWNDFVITTLAANVSNSTAEHKSEFIQFLLKNVKDGHGRLTSLLVLSRLISTMGHIFSNDLKAALLSDVAALIDLTIGEVPENSIRDLSRARNNQVRVL
jgi:hypothetical protein